MKSLTVKDIKKIENAVFSFRHEIYIKLSNAETEATKECYKALIEYYDDLIDRLNKLTVRS